MQRAGPVFSTAEHFIIARGQATILIMQPFTDTMNAEIESLRNKERKTRIPRNSKRLLFSILRHPYKPYHPQCFIQPSPRCHLQLNLLTCFQLLPTHRRRILLQENNRDLLYKVVSKFSHVQV